MSRRSRLVKRTIALAWLTGLGLVGLYAGARWLREASQRVLAQLDPATVDGSVRVAATAVALVLGTLMTVWSFAQLRRGGLARLVDVYRRGGRE